MSARPSTIPLDDLPRSRGVAAVRHRHDLGLRVGCAGWAIPSQHAHAFPAQGTHLERYAQRFTGVEVNSSFYRPHRPTTYVRWAASVPDQFQFAVKMPREITHTRRLVEVTAPARALLDGSAGPGREAGAAPDPAAPESSLYGDLAQTSGPRSARAFTVLWSVSRGIRAGLARPRSSSCTRSRWRA